MGEPGEGRSFGQGISSPSPSLKGDRRPWCTLNIHSIHGTLGGGGGRDVVKSHSGKSESKSKSLGRKSKSQSSDSEIGKSKSLGRKSKSTGLKSKSKSKSQKTGLESDSSPSPGFESYSFAQLLCSAKIWFHDRNFGKNCTVQCALWPTVYKLYVSTRYETKYNILKTKIKTKAV